MFILGIDPGLNGAMCLINQYGDILDTQIFSKFDDEFDREAFKEGLRRMKMEHSVDVAFLEKVHAMPGQGVVSMFNFGKTYGVIIGILTSFNVPITFVRPQEWMKVIHLKHTVDLPPKVRSKIAVESVYPGIDLRKSKKARTPHDGLVDALLIAEYGRRELFDKKLS
jgi:crossover junction endodeoxyribonuclease RuvC